jgi:hypothetical protein
MNLQKQRLANLKPHMLRGVTRDLELGGILWNGPWYNNVLGKGAEVSIWDKGSGIVRRLHYFA